MYVRPVWLDWTEGVTAAAIVDADGAMEGPEGSFPGLEQTLISCMMFDTPYD